jgi:acyl-CoA synthetase (AMP-forming)/AMP-acid ligase II
MITPFSEPSFEPSTLVDILRWRALHHPNRLAYTFLQDGETEEVHLTYADLDQRARAIGALLQGLGMYGERALLLYLPGLDFIAGFFGCLYAGVVAVPVYPPHPARLDRTLPRLRATANDAQPAAILTSSSLLSMAESTWEDAPDLQALRWLPTDTIDSRLAEQWQQPALDSASMVFFQYTSGSTTAPRGVMLTHGNLLYNSALIQRCFEHTAESRGVIWLPPYHDMGLIGGILQPFYSGFPVTLMSPAAFLQRPLRWLQAISRTRGTTSGGPPFAYDLCVRKITPDQRATLDLSSWDVAFTGAEPVHYETLESFAAAFADCGFRREAFYPCYGLAEATLIASGGLKAAPAVVFTVQNAALEDNRVVAASKGKDGTQTLVGCGQRLGDLEIVIVHPETQTRCLPDEVGEIWMAGPCVARGYWNRPGETERTFQAYLAETGEGPFLRTGDLGFLKDGELFITGRLKDLIIVAGHNHYPEDIEMTVESSHPSIRPGCCAAFSVAIDGEERLVIVAEVERRSLGEGAEWSEMGAWVVARAPGASGIVQAIRRAVAESHELRVYAVLLLKAGTIPKTPSGKIQRHICRTSFLAGSIDVREK